MGNEHQILPQLQKWASFGSFALYAISLIGGMYIALKVTEVRMDERIASLQRDQAKHELEKGEQIRRNMQRADDHEQRIVRLEANFSTIQDTLTEMRSDIKILIRGSATH